VVTARSHVIFQPHRYTRTLDLLDQFSGAFADADSVIVLPIYAASEEPIPGVTAESLASRIQGPVVHFVPEFGAAVQLVSTEVREGDLILTLGAGSVSQFSPANSGKPLKPSILKSRLNMVRFPCFLVSLNEGNHARKNDGQKPAHPPQSGRNPL